MKPGMVLSKPVVNASGVLILPDETELTETLIRKIMNMGIEAVFVKGTPDNGSSLEQMLSDLDKRFQHVEAAPCMDVIKKALRDHIKDLYG